MLSEFFNTLCGLLFGCPKQNEEEDCPMKKYRKNPSKEDAMDKLAKLKMKEWRGLRLL